MHTCAKEGVRQDLVSLIVVTLAARCKLLNAINVYKELKNL